MSRATPDREATIVLGGRPLDLTGPERDLLRALRRHEGQAVPRIALLRDLWRGGAGGADLVEVAVAGLRRKLGDRAGALETVRGVGYRLHPMA